MCASSTFGMCTGVGREKRSIHAFYVGSRRRGSNKLAHRRGADVWDYYGGMKRREEDRPSMRTRARRSREAEHDTRRHLVAMLHRKQTVPFHTPQYCFIHFADGPTHRGQQTTMPSLELLCRPIRYGWHSWIDRGLRC